MAGLEESFIELVYEIAKVLNLTSPIGVILLIVDILLVVLVGYYLFRAVKDTRASQILKGVGILILLLFISKAIGLVITSFILEKFMTYGALLLIVVFQPELRKALEKIGRSKFEHFFTDSEETNIKHSINEICKAIEIMSFKKVGALIVFERETKIGEIIKEGIELKAKISSELIQNIFVNKSPLHDGALMIKDNQLEAACCILPLATENKLEKSLGTRHRAGVGITEVSDAIVAIVSEETGAISFVENGKLKPNLTSEELKEELLKRLYSENDFIKAREKTKNKKKNKNK